MKLQLFDTKKRVAVDSLEADSTDFEAIENWLAPKGLVLRDNKVMDLRTLPFGETDFVLGFEGEFTSLPETQNLFLATLEEELAAYRGFKGEKPKTGVSLKESLASMLTTPLAEASVRGAIDECRKHGIPEADILAVLGDDAALAEGGTRVEGVVSVSIG